MKKLILTIGIIAFFIGNAFAVLNTPSIDTIGTSEPSPPKTLLDWGAVSGGVLYKIQYDTTASFNSPIVFSDVVKATAYYTSDLYFNSKYYYRVKAYTLNKTDSSSWSIFDSLRTISEATILKPADSTILEDVTTWARWEKIKGVSKFQIMVDTTTNFNSSLNQTFISSVDSIKIPHLYFDATYFWRVRAIDAVDTSGWSDHFVFYTPSKLQLFSPVDSARDVEPDVTMIWNRKYNDKNKMTDSLISAIKYYHYEYDTTASFNSPELTSFYTFAPGEDTVNATELLFSETYYWRVAAISNIDTSLWSDTNRYTVIDTLDLYQPTTGHVFHTLTPQLTWQPVTGITGYILQYATNSFFNNPIDLDIPAGPRSDTNGHFQFPPGQLQINVSYYWRVRAYHSKDTSSWSLSRVFMSDQGVGIVKTINENQLSVFPNPTKDKVYVTYKNNEQQLLDIRILDVLGKEIYNKEIDNLNKIDYKIDTKSFKPGIYFIQFKTDKNIISKKLIITD